jgi:hypothetical protein
MDDDDFWSNEDIRHNMLQESRDPEKLRAINEQLHVMLADFTRYKVERAQSIDSFWLPRSSPHWPERLAYETREPRNSP